MGATLPKEVSKFLNLSVKYQLNKVIGLRTC